MAENAQAITIMDIDASSDSQPLSQTLSDVAGDIRCMMELDDLAESESSQTGVNGNHSESQKSVKEGSKKVKITLTPSAPSGSSGTTMTNGAKNAGAVSKEGEEALNPLQRMLDRSNDRKLVKQSDAGAQWRKLNSVEQSGTSAGTVGTSAPPVEKRDGKDVETQEQTPAPAAEASSVSLLESGSAKSRKRKARRKREQERRHGEDQMISPNTAAAQGKGRAAEKRKHSSTPPSVKPTKKHAWEKGSYSDIAKSDLTVLIRMLGEAMTDETASILRTRLCEMLDNTKPGDLRPAFESFRFVAGACRVACANSSSCIWLQGKVREIAELNGHKLWITTAAREETRRKIVITLQDSKSASFELIFKRLSQTNEGLDTSEWALIKEIGGSQTSRTLLLGVDEGSASFIEGHGGRLYYMLQRLTVDFRGGKGLKNPAESAVDGDDPQGKSKETK